MTAPTAKRAGPISTNVSTPGQYPTWQDYELMWVQKNLLTAGVVNLAGGDFAVVQRGAGANMSVDVPAGNALIQITNSLIDGTTYNVPFYCGVTTNLAIATADPTNPRIDLIYLKVDTSVAPDSGAGNIAVFGVVTGTPGVSPAVPATPGNSLAIAKVAVAAGAASIVNANITDLRVAVGPATNVLPILSKQGLLNNASTVGGTANALTLTNTPARTAYTKDTLIWFTATASNTLAVTANMDGLGNKTFKKWSAGAIVDLASGDFMNGLPVVCYYDGTYLIVISPLSTGAGAASLTVSAKTTDYSVGASDAGTVFTNTGASGPVYETLPPATQGLHYIFTVVAGQDHIVQVTPGESLYNGTTLQKGLYASTAYVMMRLVSPNTGIWAIESIVGSWTQIFAKGYWAGGYVTGGSPSTTIGGFRFDTEAFANISATLDTSRGSLSGSSSSKKGYIQGGDTGSPSAVISALVFYNETEANIGATLTTALYYNSSGSSSTKGYVLGGKNSGEKNKIEALTFSNEASAELGATLPVATGQASGGQSSTKAYLFGGTQSGTEVKTIYSLTFSGETTATVGVTLASNLHGSGCGCSSTKAYIAGGFIAAVTGVIQAFVFSGETISTLGVSLTTVREGVTGVASSLKSYFGGGNSGATYYTAIDALVFAGETISVLSAVFAAGRAYSAGVQNGL